jgi:hypothetical protein
MKFKVGDRVRVKRDLKEGELYEGLEALSGMVELAGQVLEIVELKYDYYYRLNKSCYLFTSKMIEPYTYKKQGLVDAPIGTKITTDKKENDVYVKTEENAFTDNRGFVFLINELLENFTIIKIEEPIYTTVWEREKIKELTLSEIEEKFGCKVKIIKE